MSHLRKLAQHRVHESGQSWAIVERRHGLSILSLRLAKDAAKRGTVKIVEVVR